MLISTTHLFAQDIAIKEQIVKSVKTLNGIITLDKLNQLTTDLKELSQDGSMCFVSLDEYNNCEGNKEDVYATLIKRLDDLIGLEANVVLTKWNKPWDDENFYTLKFEIHYTNRNADFPIETNFDTLIIDVSEDKIKSIIHAREWIDLATFGE